MLFNYKILILDDDTLVTSSLKSLLILEGFNDVALFNDPFKALEYLKSNKRDVIISDFMMNDLNGIEFLSEAKYINILKNLGIMINLLLILKMLLNVLN